MKPVFTLRKQFIIFFLLVAAVSVALLAFATRTAIEMCFHDYVWTVQASAHEKIIKYFENHYEANKTWRNFDGKRIGELAKKEGGYFTIFDPHGEMIWTTENDIEPCCLDTNHRYRKNIYPIMHDGVMVARINIGQFTDHIYSPEDMAFRRSIFYGIVLSLAITLAVALPLSLLLSSRLSKPIRDLTEAADAMSAGNLSAPLGKRSFVKELSGLTESLDRLRASLLRQENLRRQLTTNISHELRTPLNIIQAQLEGMIDGVLPVNAERLESVLQEMTRLTGLVGELEKITEAEEEQRISSCEEIDLSAAAKAVADTFEGSFKRKGVDLRLECAEGLKVTASRDRLAQIIVNLISNAYKFTDSGSVTVATAMRGKSPILEVRDTGIGIDDADMENIFERFYRVEKSRNRNTGGAGLGLSIVKKIADSCGYGIEVSSKVGTGTVFKIVFPTKKSRPAKNC